MYKICIQLVYNSDNIIIIVLFYLLSDHNDMIDFVNVSEMYLFLIYFSSRHY